MGYWEVPTRRAGAIETVKTVFVDEVSHLINGCSLCDGWRIVTLPKEAKILIVSNGDEYERDDDWFLAGDYSDLPAGIEDKLETAVTGLKYSLQEEIAKRIAAR